MKHDVLFATNNSTLLNNTDDELCNLEQKWASLSLYQFRVPLMLIIQTVKPEKNQSEFPWRD